MGQIAAIECLKNGHEEKEEMKQAYNERRKMFIQSLSELGLSCRQPKGAFYAFPDITVTGMSSQEFAERLLREGKVAVVPGHVFGNGGEGFIRCSYASSFVQLEVALDRISRWLRLTHGIY